MNEFIYFEDSWNIHDRTSGSTGQTSHDSKGSWGQVEIHQKNKTQKD